MSTTTQLQPSHTDIAALSAGIVAVVVSLFVAPGEFTVINFIVSMTLTGVIYGYVWPRPRTNGQMIGVAFACALALLPACGFFVEAVRSRNPCAFLVGMYEWTCEMDQCNERKEHESRVPNGALALFWVIAAGTV